MRAFIAVLAGYLLFAVGNMIFLNVKGINATVAPTFSVTVVTLLFGGIISLLSGILTAIIEGKKAIRNGYILALLIATIAGISLFFRSGSHWTQLWAIFLLAPIALMGTVLYSKILSWINQPPA